MRVYQIKTATIVQILDSIIFINFIIIIVLERKSTETHRNVEANKYVAVNISA